MLLAIFAILALIGALFCGGIWFLICAAWAQTAAIILILLFLACSIIIGHEGEY